jgi:hypothetical protein
MSLSDISRSCPKNLPSSGGWFRPDHSSLVRSPPAYFQHFRISAFQISAGLGKAHQLFGEQLLRLLDELNNVLAA